MCLLTFLSSGVQPNVEHLRIGAINNPDGHGYAIVSGDRLLAGRGMSADWVIDEFARHRAAHPDGPAMFHSRWKTHGRIGLANCQPLPVGGDRRTVIAHNGILPASVHPRRPDRRSDTRIAADEFIPTLGPLHLAGTRARLQRWMGPHNKIVILTVDPAFSQPAYLLNADQGIWRDQIWYSNDEFEVDEAQMWASGVSCPGCAEQTPDIHDKCWFCGTCLSCGQPPETCFCYAPTFLDRQYGPVDDMVDIPSDAQVAAWWARQPTRHRTDPNPVSRRAVR